MLWATTKLPPLKPRDVGFRMYSGEVLKVLGCNDVTVCYDQQCQPLPLLVVPTDGPPFVWPQLVAGHQVELGGGPLHAAHKTASVIAGLVYLVQQPL